MSPAVGGLAEAGRAIGSAAIVGELLVDETDSDEAPWWLLKVTCAQQQVPADYKCPNLHCDVVFEYGRTMQQNVAVLLQRFRSSATGRGEDSYFYYDLDTSVEPFLFPSHLLRAKVQPVVGDVKVRVQGQRLMAVPRAKMAVAMKKDVNGKCRVYDDPF